MKADPLSLPRDTASMFSVMALPAHILEKIPAELKKNHLLHIPGTHWLPSGEVRSLPESPQQGRQGEALVSPAQDVVSLERQLEEGRLPPGAVVEFCISGGAAWGTTFALRACRAAQKQGVHEGGQAAWCAFVDPSGSLYAPGVHALGLDLSRLLVVRPDEESLSRVALRLVESQVFPLVVIDTMGVPGSTVDVSLSQWVRVVRRLSLAVSNTESTVVLLTSRSARRPLHLPVATRFEIRRSSRTELLVAVPKSPAGWRGGSVRVRAERRELLRVG